MKKLLRFDIHDLSVMVGAGFFFGSVLSVMWKWLFDAPAPHALSLLVAFIGFVGGGLLSQASRKPKKPKNDIPAKAHTKDAKKP